MAIFDREGAAKRVGKDLRTIRRWEARGWLTFTLGRVRESDLLAAEKTARENRGGDRRGKGQGMERIDLNDESLWPIGAVADGKVYSLELGRMMRLDPSKLFTDEDPWLPAEPDILDAPFEVETMTGSYPDVARRAVHLNAKLQSTGLKAFVYYPSPVEPQSAR